MHKMRFLKGRPSGARSGASSRELDFLRAELDKTVIELSDSKDRLKKREDELRELKSNLNGHITQVDSEYRLEMDQLKEENENLRRQMASISSMN